ncbi:MAG: hypothetical protein ACPHQP_01635 [Longimicrobiales bacterium]|jgi:hypothetical protein
MNMKRSGRFPKRRFVPCSGVFGCGLLVALFAIALPGVQHAAAQAAPGLDEARLRTLFGQMPVNETVQLITPEIIVDDARFVSLEPSTVELRQLGTDVPISVDLTAIRGVSVERRHWLQGTLWGLGGGLLAGSMFGLMIGSFECDSVEVCRSSERKGAVRWGLALGAVGGGVGFTLGRRDVYWKPIFP